ncbi:MAG: outer membrane lipoprotein-sorting protein [Bacteroidia bacterium]
MKRISLIIISLMLMASAGFAQTASEVVRQMEEKARGIKSLQAEMTMTIVRPKWTREISMKMWSKGQDYSMIYITGPQREKGTANLKRGKEVWTWIPRIEKTTKLPPSMMAQSWMGSDFTNDDLVREFSLSEDYTHAFIGDSTIEDRLCWKIALAPKEDAAVVWGKVVLYVSQKDKLQLRAEYYGEDDYLINVMKSSEIKNMGGRTLPTRMEMLPIEDPGNKTIMTYKSLVFDKPIDDSFFTLGNLKRVK